jgi:hypothetical protein
VSLEVTAVCTVGEGLTPCSHVIARLEAYAAGNYRGRWSKEVVKRL